MELPPRVYHWIVRPERLTKVHVHDHIRDHFDLADKTVLDFGSGTGANCCVCAPTHYHGVDPDSRRIAFARRLYPEYTFSVLTDYSLPARDHSVDCILIVSVLHHISSDEAGIYINEFRRVLRPQGKIIVLEPCLFERAPISNWFMRRCDRGAYVRAEKDYLRLLEEHNFRSRVLRRFKKCLLYNELLFGAVSNDDKERPSYAPGDHRESPPML